MTTRLQTPTTKADIQPGPSPQPNPSTLHDLSIIALCFLALSALYWAGVWFVSHRPGFGLDDAFIHLQFARNLFEHGEMSFNPGIPSSGSTAPGFCVLLAGLYALVRNWYAADFLLCGLCSLGTGWLVYAILRSWTDRRELARWAGILTVIASPTIAQAYNGMEAPVYSFIFLLGLWCYGRGSSLWRWTACSIFALNVCLRPEFLVVLPLLLLERAIHATHCDRNRMMRFLRDGAPMVIIWAIVVAAYVFYHWHQDGHLAPSTFDAKALVHADYKPEWLDGLPAALKRGNWGHALLAALVLPLVNLFIIGLGTGTICVPVSFGLGDALVARWRSTGPRADGWRLAILMFVGYPFFRAMVDPTGSLWFQQQRYFAHLTPLMFLIVIGALPLTKAVTKRPKCNWQGLAMAVQRRRTYVWALGFSLLMNTWAVLAVGNINDMQVKMADWLRDHTTPDQTIATNDIGAIGFFSRRHILDTVGLIEPGIVNHYLAGGTVDGYLTQHDPAYVVIFPNWYEKFSQREDLLERVYSIKLPFNVICGGSELVVYRPRWTHQTALNNANRHPSPAKASASD